MIIRINIRCEDCGKTRLWKKCGLCPPCRRRAYLACSTCGDHVPLIMGQCSPCIRKEDAA